MATPAPQLGFRDVLSVPSVRRLWLAQLVSIFGDFLAVFAIFSVVTFQMHGTPMQVSMILVAFLTPLAVISPFAGVYVDKWNVKWTMIASDLIRGVLVVALLFVPAQSVAVRTIAPAAGLMAVNALMSQAIQVTQIVTPAISGVLVDWLGASSCFIFDSFSFFFSAGMVMSLTINRQGATGSTAGSLVNNLQQGFRFIFTHAAISFVMISMASGMFAVRCFGALLSVYVRDILASTASTFGYLNSMIGVGMIIGTQVLQRVSRSVSKQHLVTFGLAGMGLGVLITAVFWRILTTAAGMLALGFSAAFIMVTSQTLIQQETPQEMLGRVSSSLMSLMAVSQVLAMFFAGPVADKAGLRSLYFGSAAMLAVIASIGFMKLRRTEPAAAAAD
jgi:DHA3 family macrolide efflux protein-like MFS transporter